ncbi:MAG TPA: hypothetical protein VFN97_13130 [Actinospica sp.]|nr:hypothetical protein [Actinospica sp.]
MTPVEQLVEHARTMARRARRPGSDAWQHGSLHDVVLAHGRTFEPAPLPEDVYPALPGHAARAAAILADQYAWTYVEGLALLPDMRTVIEHAWCATFTGQVVDPNLSGDIAAAYLGVAFTMNFRRTTLAHRAGAILISDPAGNPAPHPEILQHGLAPDAILAIGKPYDHAGATRNRLHWPQGPAQPGAGSETPADAPRDGVHARDRLASAA